MSEIDAFVTKYALTAGIEHRRGRLVNDGTYFKYGAYGFVVWGRDAFSTEAEAIADAEKRRDKRIANLRKQIVKLERLTFATPTPDTAS